MTMQGSFCGSDYPDLSGYPLKNDGAGKTDFITDELTGFYAVALILMAGSAGNQDVLTMRMKITAMTRHRSSRC